MAWGRFVHSLFVGAVAALAIGVSPACALDKIKVSFAANTGSYAPYFIAIEKGYFRDEGLEIEIVQAGGGTATPALIAGDLAFSTSGSSTVNPIIRGAPLKVVMVLFDRPVLQLWTLQPEIKTLADLRGKSVAIQSRGDTFEIAMRIALKRAGLDPNSVGYTPLGFGGSTRMAALKTGAIPATIVSSIEAQELKMAGALNNGRLLVDFYKEVRIPFTGSATADKLIRENPDRVRRYVRAVLKGMRYMRAFRDEGVAITMSYSKVAREPSEAEYDQVVASMTDDGTVTDQSIRDDAEVRAGLLNLPLDKVPPPDKIYDFSFARAMNADLKASGWQPTR